MKPPENPSQELSFIGDPQDVAYVCFGGKYYTANHQECIENLLEAHGGGAIEALRFIRQWFLKLEDGAPDDEVLNNLRRQYHAPVHAEIDKVLGRRPADD